MEKQIKFGVELPESAHKALNVARAQRGMKLKEATEEAFAMWVKDVDGVGMQLLEAHYGGKGVAAPKPSAVPQVKRLYPPEETKNKRRA